MKRWKINEKAALVLVTVAAAGLFGVLYANSLIPVEAPEGGAGGSRLETWEIADSDLNGAGLHEDKGIYEQDSSIYDVYISVFPTKDENGQMLDLSAFALHTARDHSYNPVLNCNIQILKEGKKPDPLLDLDHKNATIRVRGNSSRGATYKSYKVKLEEEAGTFFGQKNLNINKHSSDVSKISTKLQTDLLTQIDDIAGYRTYFMRLWIRDASLPEEEQEFVYYGLYTETEQPNKTYLETRGLGSNAAMYKASDFSFAMNDVLLNVDDPAYSEEAFETVLAIREGSDHEKLLEMLAAVNDTTTDFAEIFGTYFDEDNYLTWLAFNILMGNEDITNHNYILYNPDNALTWYFIPWDFDGALRFGEHRSTFSQPDSLRGIQMLNVGILHRRYLRLEGSIGKLDDKMKELLANVMTKSRVNGLIDSYKPVLEKTMPFYPDIDLLDMEPDELFSYIDGIYSGILDNYEAFHKAAAYPSPMFVAAPERLADGSLRFAWEASYSYQGRPITYDLRVYEDAGMQKLLFEQTKIAQTEYIMQRGLAEGTYYLQVTAEDDLGKEQLSLEHVQNTEQFVFGLLEFTVPAAP
ncbi:MAG: CotH kinase family protein [Lachnospiraceae bacterium]|nr:CotH kinase family protein [Lachnospiraceae bacterium]